MSTSFVITALGQAGRLPSSMTETECNDIYGSALSSFSTLQLHSEREPETRSLPSAMSASEYEELYQSTISSLFELKPHSVRVGVLKQETFQAPRAIRLKRKREENGETVETGNLLVDIVRAKKISCKRLAHDLPQNMDVDDAIWFRLDQPLLEYWVSLAP